MLINVSYRRAFLAYSAFIYNISINSKRTRCFAGFNLQNEWQGSVLILFRPPPASSDLTLSPSPPRIPLSPPDSPFPYLVPNSLHYFPVFYYDRMKARNRKTG